jgi:hypothetical protein
VDQEDTGVALSFDRYEWPSIQRLKTREEECEEATSGKPLA